MVKAIPVLVALAIPALFQDEAKLSGTVTDLAGRPVRGAKVEVNAAGMMFGAETGANGTYQLAVPKGTARVQVRYRGYPTDAPPTFAMPEVALERDTTINFPPTGPRLRVACLGDGGTPAKGLRLAMFPASGRGTAVCVQDSFMDSGAYVFPGLGPGKYVLAILDSGKMSLMDPPGAGVLLLDASSANPAATLQFTSATGSLNVTVTEGGSPKSGVDVLIGRPSDALDAAPPMRKKTGSNGVAAFTGLPFGSYWVAAELPGTASVGMQQDRRSGPYFAFASGGARVSAETAAAAVELPKNSMAAIRGRVTADGKPVEGARVTILSTRASGAIPGESWAPSGKPANPFDLWTSPSVPWPTACIRITDENGNYEFSKVPQGTYRIVATAPAGTHGTWKEIQLSSASASADFSITTTAPISTATVAFGKLLPVGMVVYVFGDKTASYAPVMADGAVKFSCDTTTPKFVLAQLGATTTIPAQATMSAGTWLIQPQWK